MATFFHDEVEESVMQLYNYVTVVCNGNSISFPSINKYVPIQRSELLNNVETTQPINNKAWP